MTAAEKEPIKLKCRAPSYPRPQITWKLNGTVLPHVEQIVLKVASKSDGGTYECVVSSFHGKDYHSFNLTISGT